MCQLTGKNIAPILLLTYHNPVLSGDEVMRSFVKRTTRDEKGNVLILVLILLVVGGLILTPLLGLMSTGLLAGQVYEKKMQEYYAADAGIEDALWKITHNEIPSDAYNLTVNDKYVRVSIMSTNSTQFLLDLLDLNEKNWVHSKWMITYRSPAPGTFSINITWNGTAENKRIDSAGAWLGGTYSYKEGQAIPDDDIRHEDQYPYYTFEQKTYGGGTAFIWEWSDNDRPVFNKGDTMTLTFQFEPEGTPPTSIGWVEGGSDDVGLVYDSDFALYMITAIAISDTGAATADIDSQTTVVANVIPRVCPLPVEIEVLNWNIS
jgi:hypothetical protein